jgi:hypothetical protein
MVKMAPHFGHFKFVSLDTPAHPKEKAAKNTNAKKMFTHFVMLTHPLSSKNIIQHHAGLPPFLCVVVTGRQSVEQSKYSPKKI